MNRNEKERWSYIGKLSWRLAKEAVKKAKTGEALDEADYIWAHVDDYDLNEYEKSVMGQWACDNLDKLKEGKE